jgi:hypothetical protein
MFLAVMCGHPVTPSEQVDQVWHLHLIYTRSYWDEFCGRVLGQRVHHGPTKGGDAEEAKYHDWYERTKESYARLFGDQPPAEIWPASAARFGDDLHERRVNTRRNWIIPKPCLPRSAAFWIGIAVLGLLAAMSALGARALGDEWPRWSPTPLAESAARIARSGEQFSADAVAPLAVPIAIAVMAIAFLVVGLLAWLVWNPKSCSACHRRFALVATGATKPSVTSGATLEELQCKYCGQSTWTSQATDSGWSGCGFGCSTSSGCGGCSASGCGGGCGGCGGCGG